MPPYCHHPKMVHRPDPPHLIIVQHRPIPNSSISSSLSKIPVWPSLLPSYLLTEGLGSPGVRSLWLPLFSPHPPLVLSQPSPVFLVPSHYLTHFSFSSPLCFSSSYAGSSCSWMPYWLGFLFTFTHIPLRTSPALSESRSLDFFCSPVYCNTPASLIRVFVSVYLLLS